jgi:hypothetical protein
MTITKGGLSLANLTTDQAAEEFLDQDLSTLDFTQFKPLRLDPAPPREPEPAPDLT